MLSVQNTPPDHSSQTLNKNNAYYFRPSPLSGDGRSGLHALEWTVNGSLSRRDEHAQGMLE